MNRNPHFDLPFRLSGSTFVTVEQDSLRDVQNCVEAIVRTHVGERQSLPDFGTDDPTFRRQPLSKEIIEQHVIEWEPRAVALMEEEPDEFDRLVDRVRISIGLVSG
jgi:phage baseplate assembly protein W